MTKRKDTIPFDFVIEQLYSLDPLVKPMFGCHAIYVRNKIVLMLRKKVDFTEENGVWIGALKEYHATLKLEFPSLRPITLFGETKSDWQNLPEDAEDFEESVLAICNLILKNDPRVGKVPKNKKKSDC